MQASAFMPAYQHSGANVTAGGCASLSEESKGAQDAKEGTAARRELQQCVNDPPILAFGRLAGLDAARVRAEPPQRGARSARGRRVQQV